MRSLRCKAKQSTLLYISETLPTDSVLFEVFLGQGYSLVCSMHLKKKRKKKKKKLRDRKREEKHRLFFCSLWSVTLFDISTEGLVVQQLLPGALIETLLSNRKWNKCSIELKQGQMLYLSALHACMCVCVCMCSGYFTVCESADAGILSRFICFIALPNRAVLMYPYIPLY